MFAATDESSPDAGKAISNKRIAAMWSGVRRQFEFSNIEIRLGNGDPSVCPAPIWRWRRTTGPGAKATAPIDDPHPVSWSDAETFLTSLFDLFELRLRCEAAAGYAVNCEPERFALIQSRKPYRDQHISEVCPETWAQMHGCGCGRGTRGRPCHCRPAFAWPREAGFACMRVSRARSTQQERRSMKAALRIMHIMYIHSCFGRARSSAIPRISQPVQRSTPAGGLLRSSCT